MVFWLCRHGEHSLCVCRGQGHNPAAEPQGVQPSLMRFAKILVPCQLFACHCWPTLLSYLRVVWCMRTKSHCWHGKVCRMYMGYVTLCKVFSICYTALWVAVVSA
jgi:hypothetical protein